MEDNSAKTNQPDIAQSPPPPPIVNSVPPTQEQTQTNQEPVVITDQQPLSSIIGVASSQMSPPKNTDSINKDFFQKNFLLTASFVLYGFNLILLMLSYLSTSYETVSSYGSISMIIGGLGALLMGAGSIQFVMNTLNDPSKGMNSEIKIGLLVMLASIVVAPAFIAGIILLIIGLRKPASNPNSPASSGEKALISVGAFIGAGGAGLAISVIIMFMISDRACQLTSSKCY